MCHFLRYSKEKTLLFFVIRDFIGNTPLENLAKTINTDLGKIWRELSKVSIRNICCIVANFDGLPRIRAA